MLKKYFNNPKTRYRNLALIILPFILLIGLFGFIAFSSAKGLLGGSKLAYSIDSMDYHLRSNATDYQKELFKELSKLCAVEEEAEKDKLAIASSVVENYIADFYTWTNKAGSYDVGGLYYVHSPSKGNIYAKARDKFYKYVTHYINEYSSEVLLEVEEDSIVIEGSKTKDPYVYNGNNYDAYYFHASWNYVDHEGFNEKTYKSSENFLVIENEDGRFEIVQAYGD